MVYSLIFDVLVIFFKIKNPAALDNMVLSIFGYVQILICMFPMKYLEGHFYSEKFMFLPKFCVRIQILYGAR